MEHRNSVNYRDEDVSNLIRILQDVVENTRTDGHPQRNISLKMKEEYSSVEVCGDEKKVRKEIEECLNEALKYDPTSDVTICLEKGEEVAYITVSPYSSEQSHQENNLTHWLEFMLYEG